jgi:hypothetical protein
MISVTLARIDENLLAARVSRGMFATVCGLKPSTLSAAFNGVVNLGGPREAELLTTSFRLVELRAASEPFSLPPNAGAVKILVQRLQDGTLSVETIRAAVAALFGVDAEKFE